MVLCLLSCQHSLLVSGPEIGEFICRPKLQVPLDEIVSSTNGYYAYTAREVVSRTIKLTEKEYKRFEFSGRLQVLFCLLYGIAVIKFKNYYYGPKSQESGDGACHVAGVKEEFNMLDRETLLTFFDATSRSLVFNLNFIPSDKLDWKPAPEAKSALEIANHLTEFLRVVNQRLNPDSSAFTPATTVDEAKAGLTQVSAQFIAAVRGASTATLNEQFREDHPFTTGWLVTVAIMDAGHHHGQIAYIQTLLGDNEIHGDASSTSHFTIS